MRTDRIGWLVAVVVILSVVAPAAARAQAASACDSGRPAIRRGGWLLDVSYRTHGPGQSANNLKQIGLGMHFIPLEGDQALVFFLGGIHIQADDFNGRRIGSECGLDAWARAQLYYAGTVGS